jgi:hypothetical protein
MQSGIRPAFTSGWASNFVAAKRRNSKWKNVARRRTGSIQKPGEDFVNSDVNNIQRKLLSGRAMAATKIEFIE